MADSVSTATLGQVQVIARLYLVAKNSPFHELPVPSDLVLNTVRSTLRIIEFISQVRTFSAIYYRCRFGILES